MCSTRLAFIAKVNSYMSANIPTSRAEAYDICHGQFVTGITTGGAINYDNLALHLYAFLASWGMVRGNSILLQHNYTVLIPVVKVVCDKKYSSLLDVDVFSGSFNKSTYITLMMELKNSLAKALFGRNAKYTDDTLLSKIALVSLGCVVGYDSRVKASLKSLGYAKSFSKKGLGDLLNFANTYKADIKTLQAKYSNFNYSVMKICDCALF